MGSQGETFPRGICMLIEDTGNPGTASRSQMKEVPRWVRGVGTAPWGPAVQATLIRPVWTAAGLGFPPAAFTKKWFGEEQSDCVYPQARVPVPGLCAPCPAQSRDSVDFAQWLFLESMEKALLTSPCTFSPIASERLKPKNTGPRPGQLLFTDENITQKKFLLFALYYFSSFPYN